MVYMCTQEHLVLVLVLSGYEHTYHTDYWRIRKSSDLIVHEQTHTSIEVTSKKIDHSVVS